MSDWENPPSDLEIQNNVGFIYVIQNNVNGMYYIGQKKFFFKRTLKPLKGRKNKRHKLVPSDWKTYWGSCEALQKDIKECGEVCFTRKILKLCRSKAEMNYEETKKQFMFDVLLDPKSYNGIINCRISKNQLKNL